ncbi:MAG: hypothetical protein R2860_01850 [Desulfobacterales bacterium]
MFAAYFVENNNIGDPDVLTALAASVGLDRHGPCRDGGRQYQKQVDADWKAAAENPFERYPPFLRAAIGWWGLSPMKN